jgi:hypothetical protein
MRNTRKQKGYSSISSRGWGESKMHDPLSKYIYLCVEREETERWKGK